jgi:hypothetical protein
MLSISFTPLSVALTAIRHRKAATLKCTLRSGGWRHRSAEILEDDNVLIEVKATPRLGDTLVPLIFMPDGTHLSNFAVDKKEWPVYMPIGNLCSKICQMPTADTVVMVALLPIPIKNRNIPQTRLDEQQQTNREVLNEVLRRVLQLLTCKLKPSTESGYYHVL